MSTASRSNPPAPTVSIFGPTGVGKTRLLLDILPPGFEVIAADSVQVYRGLDIGSAKPTPEERARVPHHLIDIRDPGEPFDVGDFVTEAKTAVVDISTRGRIPVLSGGTAFYFHNYHLGLPETPPADLAVRDAVQLRWQEMGEDAFRAALAAVDPVSAARIAPHDAYRLQRAWEVWLQSGRPLSSFGRTGGPEAAAFIAGLDRPRDELYARIEARVDAMLAEGLEAEVRALAARGVTPEHGLTGIGYVEWFPFVTTGEGSLHAVRDAIAQNSRRYAKRQLTFFRSLPNVRWYHPDEPEKLLADLREWSLTNAPHWC